MNKIYFLLSFILICQNANSQWHIKVFSSEKESICNVLQILPEKEKIKDPRTFMFYGTAEELDENVITSGLKPFEKGHNNDWSWRISLGKNANFNSQLPVSLYINFFSKNVDSLNIRLKTKSGISEVQTIKVPHEKYIFPFEIPFFEKDTSENKQEQQVLVDSLVFKLIKKEKSKNFEFVIAECKLYQRNNTLKKAKAEFLYDLTNDIEHKPQLYEYSSFGTSYPIKHLASYSNFEPTGYIFEPDTTYNQNERDIAFFDLIKHIFKRYPHYKEHNLDSTKLSNKLHKILDSEINFASKLENIQALIRDFHDGHFRLNLPEKQIKKTSPLYAYRLQNGIHIAAVFVESLKESIYPGMKIKSINNIPIDAYIDSLAMFEYGDEAERTELAVSRLFRLGASDSLFVELNDQKSSTKKVKIKGGMKFSIPNRFRPKQFDFYTTNNNWGYLRINSWDTNNWIDFLNLSDTLKTLNGIIFDLRGNPGGEELGALRIASCFIKKPVEYSHLFYGNLSASKSNTLIPNRFIDLSNLRVKILANHKTACASEQFIHIMKQTASASVIGAETTSGTYANASEFIFPNGVTLTTPVIQKNCLDHKGNSIEYSGFKPDILITLNSFEDLYGYDDKILKTAFED